jgi:putative ABC transport system permease protein
VLRVTRRNLVAHRQRLLLTVVAVVVSVAFMTGTQVLTATVGASFDKVFADIYGHVDVVVRSTTAVETGLGAYRAPVAAEVLDPLRRAAGVVAVEGQVQGQVSLLDRSGRPLGAAARFGPPTYGLNWLQRPELNGWVLSAGRPPVGSGEVVIDRRSAGTGGYAVGDQIGVQVLGGVRRFTIVGIAGFGTTPDYAGSPAALFETPVAQELLAEPGRFNWIEVAGATGLSQEDLRARVAAELPDGTEAVTGRDFTRESQNVLRQIFDTIGKVLLAFGLVAVFVGSFIIHNTFTIIVAQRTREVALLRALGASRAQVVGSVAAEAVAVGVLASALGLVAGVGQAAVLRAVVRSLSSAMDLEPLTFTAGAFTTSFAIGVAITVVSALLPARRASKVPPVAALRRVATEAGGHGGRRLLVAAALGAAGAAALGSGLLVPDDRSVIRTGAGIAGIMLAAIVAGPAISVPLSRALGAPLRSFPGRLARANAMRNPRRTAATASALMIGVALIVLFAIVVQSLKSSVDSGVTTAFTADLIVDSGAVGPGGLDRGVAAELAAVPGVAADGVLGLEVGVATVGGQPAQVLGADLGRLAAFVTVSVRRGDLAGLREDEVAVPEAAADDKHLSVGDRVPMTMLAGGERTFRVGAVYDIPGVGGLGYLLSPGGFDANVPPAFQSYSQIHLRLAPGADPAAARRAVEDLVTARFPAARVVDVGQYGASQTEQLDVMLLLIYALLLLAVLVAGLGIINTLLLSVHERTREIGLLRAVGMERSQVRAAVRWESVIVSLQGTVIGMGVGALFAWALVTALGRESPVFGIALPWLQLAAVPAGALVAGVVAAVLPARTASRLAVLDAVANS